MVYGFGPFELDAVQYELRRDDQVVALQRRAFDLLVVLVREPGRVHTRPDLLRHVWQGIVSDDAIVHAVRAIRAALGDTAHHSRYIENVRGRGYRFAAPVCELGPRGVTDPSAELIAALAYHVDAARALLRAIQGDGAQNAAISLEYVDKSAPRLQRTR